MFIKCSQLCYDKRKTPLQNIHFVVGIRLLPNTDNIHKVIIGQ